MSAPALGEVLRRLAAEGRIDAALADPGTAAGQRAVRALAAAAEAEGAPWFLRLFVIVGSWIGALVAALFLVLTELLSAAPPTAILGVLLLGGAVAAVRRLPASTWAHQLVWILTVGGQVALLVAVTLAFSSFDGERLLLALALLQIPTLALISHPPLRLASVFTLVAAATAWLATSQIAFGVDALAVVTAALVVALWLGEHRLAAGPAGAAWRPVSLGLAAGLLVPLVTLLYTRELSSAGSPLPGSPEAVTLALGVLALVVVGAARREVGERRSAPVVLLAAVGIAAVAALAHAVPGLVGGLLLVLLAHLRRDRVLEALGLLSLAFFLTFFYYSLEVPLLEKSLWVTATGVVLAALGIAAGRFPAAGEAGGGSRRPLGLVPAEVLRLAAALALALGLVGVSIVAKERVLRDGETLLLELRPVDPRSLLQGDYMALRYALADEVAVRRPLTAMPRQGRLVVRTDEGGVARFVRVFEGGELAAGEGLLRYRVRTGRWGDRDLRLGAESFFFEEGTADLYDHAGYGELKVDAAGEAVLVGLRDTELRPLGNRLH